MFAFLWRVLALSVFSASVWAAEPIRIGVSGPFSGDSWPVGLSMRDGIRIAAEEVNASGGVLGRPLLLIERDDEGRNVRGAQVAQDLVGPQRVVATVGMVNTGVALASQRVYQARHIPVITAVATGSLITRQFVPPAYADNYIFRTACSDTLQAGAIVDDAVDHLHLRKLAIFHDATNVGRLGRADLEHALARKGLRPVWVEQFRAGVDIALPLRHARQVGAEGVLVFGVGAELARVPGGMAKIGWRVPLMGNWTLSMPAFIDAAGPLGEGARMPQTYILDDPAPRRTAFRDAWRKLSGGRMASPSAAAQGYDALMLLAAAIAQAGSEDGAQIRAALEDLAVPVEGLVTTYRKPFSPLNHEAIRSPHMVYLGELRGGSIGFSSDEDRRRAAVP